MLWISATLLHEWFSPSFFCYWCALILMSSWGPVCSHYIEIANHAWSTWLAIGAWIEMKLVKQVLFWDFFVYTPFLRGGWPVSSMEWKVGDQWKVLSSFRVHWQGPCDDQPSSSDTIWPLQEVQSVASVTILPRAAFLHALLAFSLISPTWCWPDCNIEIVNEVKFELQSCEVTSAVLSCLQFIHLKRDMAFVTQAHWMEREWICHAQTAHAGGPLADGSDYACREPVHIEVPLRGWPSQ
jgi:hypothetical protein